MTLMSGQVIAESFNYQRPLDHAEFELMGYCGHNAEKYPWG